MALTATMRRFEVALADADHDRYDTLDLRVAQHPSESERFLIARVIARVLQDGPGVEFTRGLSTDDEPAIWQRDLRGDLQAWIEIGQPSVDRLHKASKTGARVVVYAWKAVDELAAAIAARPVHRAAEVEVYALPPEFLDAVAATLDRNNSWSLSITGGALFLAVADVACEAEVRRVAIG
ncbi:MAG: YaeQ family protein [Kofleriaceae bacterium]